MLALPRLLSYALILLVADSLRAETPTELLRQAESRSNAGDSEAAVRLATQALESDSELAAAYYLRGRQLFRLGRIEPSVHDFDRYVELKPQIESRQWERGIAYFYAKKFKQGAKQFELYQTYHNADVENSVWRFLCMVPEVGVERARSAMLPISGDRRVPMMDIYELYRGRVEPETVLAAVGQDDPPTQVLAGRQFYADLYLGLYFDALGQTKRARQHIDRAANAELETNAHLNRYMWDVARIHQQQLKDAPASAEKAP